MQSDPSPTGTASFDQTLADWIEARVERIAASPIASLAAIFVVAFLAFLPGFTSLPPIDRDEPRFAQATRQMVETGNYFDIRFQDEARYKKPIGIYWLQAAAVALTGSGPQAPIFIYRLPSLLGGIAMAMLTWWLAMAFGNPRRALLAGMMVAATILVGVEARLAKTDMVLLVTITAMHGALARAWLDRTGGRSIRRAAIFWTALAASILIKGPVGVGAVLCPLIGLCLVEGSAGWLRRLRPLAGLLWALILVAPWFIAIGLASHGAFYSDSLGQDFLQKIGSAQESHGAPPGTYALVVIFTFWPIAAFFLAGLGALMDRLRQPLVLYAALSVIPYWLVIEAVPTKLPHYALPLFPLLALASAYLVEGDYLQRASRHLLMRFFSLSAMLMPIALAMVGLVLTLLLGEAMAWAGFVMLALSAATGFLSWRLWPRSSIAAAVTAILAALIAYAGIFGLILPSFEQTRLSGRLVAAAHTLASCPRPILASAGFEEPSLVFLGGTDLQLIDGARAASFLAEGGCRVAFVEEGEMAAFRSRADDLGSAPKEGGLVRGFNLNTGRFLALHVFLPPKISP